MHRPISVAVFAFCGLDFCGLAFCGLALCGLAGFLPGQSNGPSRTRIGPNDQVTEQTVHDAIRFGIAYLEKTQKLGRWDYRTSPMAGGFDQWTRGGDCTGGLTALSLYALSASGVASDKASIQDGVAWCKAHPQAFEAGTRSTYSASLLVLALTRIDPVQHKKWIHQLAAHIAESQLPNGMWNYELRPRGKAVAARRSSGAPQWGWLNSGDGSNTQFAVLAIWAAQTTAQYRAPVKVWKGVRDLHTRTQQDNGGWSYKVPRKDRGKATRSVRGSEPRTPAWMYGSTPAMTSAGVVAYTCATAGLAGGVRGLVKARQTKVAQSGLAAFRANSEQWDTLFDDYYFAYSVERVGTLSGLPDSEWYQPLANRLGHRQLQDGRWARDRRKGGITHGDDQQVYETSLALLCLSKASRHPITPRPKTK